MMVVVNIMVASGFAKHSWCIPLGDDFYCAYGVPFALWEQVSHGGKVHTGWFSGQNPMQFLIGFNAPINLLLDLMIAVLLGCFLLWMRGRTWGECCVNASFCGVTIYLSCMLWVSALTDWRYGLHGFIHLTILASYIILLLLAISRGILAVRKQAKPKTNPGGVNDDCRSCSPNKKGQME